VDVSTDHHAMILQMMLANSDRLSAQIAELDGRIQEALSPFCAQSDRLADIPGVDVIAAAELIAEVGVDMTRFPSAAHLVSWAKFCPQTRQSAGKSKSQGRGKGNPWLAGDAGPGGIRQLPLWDLPGRPLPAPGPSARQTKSHRRHRQFVLTVVYHLLLDADARFCDLGPGYYESRIDKHRRARDLATQLQALTGQHIVIRDGKTVITYTPPPNPKTTPAQRDPAPPGTFSLPAHHPIFGSAAAVVRSVQVGVRVDPDHKGLRVMFRDAGQCRQRRRAARERREGDVPALDNSDVFALQFAQSRKRGRKCCQPGFRVSGLRLPDQCGREVKPLTQFMTHDGCALHAAIVVITCWANKHDEATFFPWVHHSFTLSRSEIDPGYTWIARLRRRTARFETCCSNNCSLSD